MSEVFMRKLPGGVLAPANDADSDALERVKTGEVVRCKIVRPRNIKFHRKFFALIEFLFDIWSETVAPRTYRGTPVMPNLNRFRRDLIILTGRYDATYNALGEVRLEAQSMSFANMGEAEFERLYSDVIQVALDRVLNRPDLDEGAVRAIVEDILAFA